MNKITSTLFVLCCFFIQSFAASTPSSKIDPSQLTITGIQTTPSASILSNTYWDEETSRIFNVDLFGSYLVTYSYTDKTVHTLLIEDVANPAIFLPVRGTTDQYLVSSNGSTFLMQWDGESDTVQKGNTLFDLPGHVDSAYVGPNGRLYVGNFATSYCLDTPTFGLFRYSAESGLAQYSNDLGSTVGGVIIDSTYYHLDACEKKLSAYNLDPDTGNLSNKRHVLDLDYPDVLPIGLAADKNGKMYTGMYNKSCVFIIDPSIPAVIDQIDLPTPLVLAPIFGGPNKDILFVATGTQPIDFDDNQFGEQRQDAESGDLFMVEGLGVEGVPSYRPVV